MNILAIDPGNKDSAYVLYDTETKLPISWEKTSNAEVLALIECSDADQLYLEMIASYGMPVGASVFETCIMIGRCIEVWGRTGFRADLEAHFIYRREVKLHLCNSAKAKDANVRQALIDRYGGKEKAIGKKAIPGPLYGMKADCWAALGVAITAAEKA
jgi:hypothetical protein